MTEATWKETWEEPFHQANKLLAEGHFEGACSVLRSAALEAKTEGSRPEAAFYSNVLGSFLSSRSDTRGALEAYEEAERLDPGQVQWKLSTADFLLAVCDRAAEALAKAVAVREEASDSALFHTASATVGLAHFHLGDVQAALEAFDDMSQREILEDLPPSACDLRLAEALIDQGLAGATCSDYLKLVRQKAHTESDQGVLAAVGALLTRVDKS